MVEVQPKEERLKFLRREIGSPLRMKLPSGTVLESSMTPKSKEEVEFLAEDMMASYVEGVVAGVRDAVSGEVRFQIAKIKEYWLSVYALGSMNALLVIALIVTFFLRSDSSL